MHPSATKGAFDGESPAFSASGAARQPCAGFLATKGAFNISIPVQRTFNIQNSDDSGPALCRTLLTRG